MDHNEILNNKHINKKAKICSFICLLFFLLIGIGLVTVVLIFKNQALDYIFSYQEWIKNNFLITLFIFYCCLIFGGILVLPTAVFEIVNGFIYSTLFDGEFYGLFLAVAVYLIFTAISGTLTYKFSKWLLGRKLKQVLVETSDRMKMLNYIFKNQGFKAMFLIRLSPLLPSAMFNYLVSGFDISYKDFFLSSFGCFPLTSFYIYIGFSTISIESLERNMDQNSIISIILMIFGIVVLVFSLLYFGRYAKRNFNKMMEDNKGIKDYLINDSLEENILSEETIDTLSTPINVQDTI